MNTMTEISERRLAWLRSELGTWQTAGMIDAASAGRIEARYVSARGRTLRRLVLGLGGTFFGIGLSWAVAANIDQLSSLARMAGITLIWLAALVLGERIGTRAGAGTARLTAALALGGVVFQAAQILNVPAGSPGPLGVWAAGALAYAYATAALGPLTIGVGAGAGWYAWLAADRGGEGPAFAMALMAAAVVASAVAVLHERRWRPEFGSLWRHAGALFALGALFTVAMIGGHVDGLALSWSLGAGLAVAVAAVAAALALTGREGLETLAVAVMTAAAVPLLLWTSGAQLAHTLTGCAVYVLAAAWFIGLGTYRGAPYLTGLATSGLALFVIVQSFAGFSSLLSGAALFLALGAAFLLAGVLVHRGGRLMLSAARG